MIYNFSFDHVVFGPVSVTSQIDAKEYTTQDDVEIISLTSRHGDLLRNLTEPDLKTIRLRALAHYERTNQNE